MQKISEIVLLFALIALPIYAFPSGTMQIGHYLLFIFSLIYLFNVKIKERPKWWSVLVLLLLFSVVREVVAVFFRQDLSSLFPLLFQVFNILVVGVLYDYSVREQKIAKIIVKGSVAGICVAALGLAILGVSLVVGGESGGAVRAVGTFNNPNQLGYFSVCGLSLVYLFLFRGFISFSLSMVLLIICVFLAVASLSKAAMLAMIPAIILIILHNKLKGWTKLIYIAVLLIIIFFGVIYVVESDYLLRLKMADRVLSIGKSNDDSFGARGYLVIMNGNAFEVFFGLGNQKARDLIGHEVHSTLFSYLGSYGIVGLYLISYVFYMWGRKLLNVFGKHALFGVWLPPMLYGITHNGSRFTAFWILFVISLSLTASKFQGRNMDRVAN